MFDESSTLLLYMASTRNKNSIGDYKLETTSYTNHAHYMVTNDLLNTQNYLPGNGIIGQKCTGDQLSKNPTDIESFLFGINSTNLEGSSFQCNPELKELKTLSIQERTPIILPQPLVIESNQRPFPR